MTQLNTEHAVPQIPKWCEVREAVEASIPTGTPQWMREAIVECARREGASRRHEARVNHVIASAGAAAMSLVRPTPTYPGEWRARMVTAILLRCEIAGLGRIGAPPLHAPHWFVARAGTRRGEWWDGGTGRPQAMDAGAWDAAVEEALQRLPHVVIDVVRDDVVTLRDDQPHPVRVGGTGGQPARCSICIPDDWPVVREQLARLAIEDWNIPAVCALTADAIRERVVAGGAS